MADTLNSDLVSQTAVTVNLTPETFVRMTTITKPDITTILDLHPEIQNYAAAAYTCEGDTFTYWFDDYVAIWHRK